MYDKLVDEHGLPPVAIVEDGTAIIKHLNGLINYRHSNAVQLLESDALQNQVATTAMAYAMASCNPSTVSNAQAQRKAADIKAHSFNRKQGFLYFNDASISRDRLLVFFLLTLLAMFGPRPAICLVNADHLSRQEYISGEKSGLAPFLGEPFDVCSNQVPFKADSAFIGRSAEIEAVHQVLRLENARATAQQRRLVVEGPVGVGKTHLAVAYAKRWANEYGKVLWVDAASEAMTKSSFSYIYDCLAEHDFIRPFINEGVADTVKRWLSHKDNERWLLVFDGYEESMCFNIKSYYPEADHGSILITTRQSNDVNGTKVKLNAFDDDDDVGMQIIKSNSQPRNIHNDLYAPRLASALRGVPAAFSAAGVYLRYSGWTYEQYFHAHHSMSSTLPPQTSSLGEENQMLYAAWDLLHQHLQHYDHVAEQMLILLAVLGRSHVWFGFFYSQQDHDIPAWARQISCDRTEFDTIMRRLVDYGFVEVQSTLQVYILHTSIREWILSRSTDRVQPWSHQFILGSILKSIDGRSDIAGLGFTRLVPPAVELAHTKFSFVLQENNEQRILEIRTIYFLLKRQNQLDEAQEILDGTLEWYEQTLGPEHPSTLLIATELAQLYDRQNKDTESEQLYKQVLATSINGLGREHVSTARVFMFLGELYATRDNRLLAEDMYLQALVGFEKSQGERHVETLCMVYRLGRFYMDTGRLTEAWRFFQRGYDASLEVLGTDHGSTIDTTYKLAQVYALQGRRDEAEDMYQRALLGYEKTLGENHLSTISVSQDLARLYNLLDRQADAERLYSRVVSGAETLLGPNHKDTLDALTNLAQIYQDQGKFDEAEKAIRRVMAGQEAVLGLEHVAMLQATTSLGYLFYRQGRVVEAEDVFQQVFTGFEMTVEGNYLNVVNAAILLGNFYHSQNRTEEAERAYLRSLFESEKHVSTPNEGTIMTTYKLGFLYTTVGRYAEGEQMFLRSLAESRLLYDDYNAHTLQTVQSLAQLYLNYGTEHQLQRVESQFPHVTFGYDKTSPDAFKQLF